MIKYKYDAKIQAYFKKLVDEILQPVTREEIYEYLVLNKKGT